MQATEAIRKLQQIKQVKKQGEDNNQSNTFAKGLMNFKNIIVGAMSDLTGLILANEPSVKVLNFPKGTTINNKVLKVEVTNHPKKESIEKVEVINQPEINFSTTSLEAKLSKIELGLEKIAPMMRTSSTEALVESSKLIDEVKQLQSAIKKIKLDPQITVKPADVKVDAPVVNVKETKIPPFPKKITADVDMSVLEDKIDELITETQYAYTQPVVVANPGDFPVSTTNTRDLAKEAKQLPDNHNVTVSNIDATPLITGFSTSNNQTNGNQVTKIKETPPTDSSKTNGSLVITYNASNQPTTIEKTISGTVYTKTLTWTGDVCTAVSAWS